MDGQGNPVVLDWSGEKTFRLTMGGPQEDTTKDALQMNYLMFVPKPPPAPFSLLHQLRNGSNVSVSFPTEAGYNYALHYKNALTDPTWTSTGATVAGDGSVKTLQDASGESHRFYRVSAQ